MPRDRMEKSRVLVKAAKEALEAGISVCKPGGCLSDIGFAIHDVVDKYGFDTVREYRGHGIGSDFHIAPFVKVSVLPFKIDVIISSLTILFSL